VHLVPSLLGIIPTSLRALLRQDFRVYTHYGCVRAIPTIESLLSLSPEPLKTIVGLGVVSNSSHVLKVMPRDIIRQMSAID